MTGDMTTKPPRLTKFRGKLGRRAERFRATHHGTHSASRLRSKHMRRWIIADPATEKTHDMLTPIGMMGYANTRDPERRQYPIESLSTQPRPWDMRRTNRARGKRAKASRKANR